MKKIILVTLCFLYLVAGACTPSLTDGGNGAGPGIDPGTDDGNGTNNDNGGGGNDGTGNSNNNSENGRWLFGDRLEAFDPMFEDFYGDSVATSGTTVLVGTGAKNSLNGIVDIFIQFGSEWRFLQRIVGGDARFPEQDFGRSVALGNNEAFIGAPKFSIEGSFAIQTGSVYIYENVGPEFTQNQLLTVIDAQDFELIGSSLAYERNQSRLVVGAPGRDRNQGAAYVFSRNGGGYAQEDRLQASDGINFEDFGQALVTENQSIIVGAPNQNFGTGAVYVYERTAEWTETQKILAPDGAQTDKFGSALALEGDTLVISAPGKKRPGDDLLKAGYVYIYRRSSGTWELEQTLIPDDDLAGLFGLALALEDGLLAITAGGIQAVDFLEEQDGEWVAVDRLEPQRETFVLDSFGNALAITEGTLIVGARSADANGARAAGAAYVYSYEESSGEEIPDGVRF